MQNLINRFGRTVRLTDERAVHIENTHPEMTGFVERIAEVLQMPDYVAQSNWDSETELFYRFYETTTVGSKWLCVVVKVRSHDAFVITAYLADAIKKGTELWKKP